jgi:hypothetical protein
MKTKKIVIATLTFLLPLLFIGLVGCVGVPSLTADYSHQGKLTTSSGMPVPDGNYTIQYRLFHAATDGTAVYTQTNTVPVKGGLFDTSIGLTSVITPEIFSQPTWMEVSVNGEVFTPRQRLEGAPYASSLVAGAVIQGYVPITRTYGTFTDLGGAMVIWNQDSSKTGGNGLTVIDSAQPAGAAGSGGKVAALQAAHIDTDIDNTTGGYGAMIRSDDYRGMYVQGNDIWYTAVFSGAFGIEVIGGGCTGCTLIYQAQNAGTDTIQPGEFVAADGVVVDPDMNIPVLQVHKAASAKDVIIGVATGALDRAPVGNSNGWTTGGFDGKGGPAANGQYLSVVVQGLVHVRVDQPAALQFGDWITIENGLVTAALGDAPKVARLMSAVDGNGMAWIMYNGQ